MENVTKDSGMYEIVQSVTCAAPTQGNQYLFVLTAINIVLAITAALGNILVFFALRRISSLQPASRILLRSLIISDFCVGVCVQPLYAIQLLSMAQQRLQLCYALVSINEIVGTTLSGVSLCTLTAISLDRLLALCMGLSYKHVITLRRTRRMIIILWFFNILFSNLRRFWRYVLISNVMSSLIYCTLSISALSYLTIYLKLRKHREQVQRSVHQRQPNEQGRAFNISKYRKTVYTALCVQLALVVCYFPYGIVVALAHTRGYNSSYNFIVCLTISLVLLNSSLNPILYCWRINGVKQVVKAMIRSLGLLFN